VVVNNKHSTQDLSSTNVALYLLQLTASVTYQADKCSNVLQCNLKQHLVSYKN